MLVISPRMIIIPVLVAHSVRGVMCEGLRRARRQVRLGGLEGIWVECVRSDWGEG